MRYISVGRRFAALLLDWIILLVVAIPLAEIHSGNGSVEISWLGWRFALAWIAVPLTYVVLFEWLASATPWWASVCAGTPAAGSGSVSRWAGTSPA